MSLQTNSKIVKWIEFRLPIISAFQHAAIEYPTPKNLSYWWNFGSLAGIVLVIQIVTGIVLAMHYTPNTALAFDSIQHIMRDVNYGWLLRYIHMNGASMFFIVVYIHIFRGLYYGSYKYPRELLWWIGIIIFLAMMATAFMGYVLPWGQMSFWGATVITNLFSAIPGIGQEIVTWLRGGFAVDNPTLNRFFSLHYLLPFIIVGLVMVHIMALHQHGSNNPLGIDRKGPQDSIPFHPYYTVKDLFGLMVFLLFFSAIVFYIPNQLGDPAQFTLANPLQTPEDIVPEWYFLPFYAILRSVPNILFIPAKLAGVICMFGSIFLLFLLPWLDTSPVRSGRFRPIFRQFYVIFILACIGLEWAGSQKPEGFALVVGRVCTSYYFLHFLIILPLVGWFETPKPLPKSISEPVLTGGAVPAGVAREKP